MKRTLLWATALLVAASFSGCQLFDSLFFNTEEVKASEVPTYTGSTPTNKDEALTSACLGLSVAALGTGLNSISFDVASTPAIVAKAFPDANVSEIYARFMAIARTVSSETEFQTFLDDLKAEGAGSCDVAFSDSNLGFSSLLSVNGTFKASASGYTTGSSAASADVEADLDVEVSSIAATVFNGGKATVKVRANSDATMNGDSLATASGYAAVALSAGFSLDEFGSIKGGKYIIIFKHTNNYDYDASAESWGASLSLDVTVKVYDGSNSLVGSYTYTEDELQAALVSLKLI